MRVVTTLAFASFSLLSAPALADGPEAFSIDLPASEIYGGAEVAACGWPTTVSVEGNCTGTLVHPEVVIYAAHCGSGYNQIRFGESIDGGPGRTVQTEFCKTYPGGGPGSGNDWAFCKLAEPVTDVKIVPILMGCETDVLVPGTEVVIVGFGSADNGPYGIKREVTTTINQITPQGEAGIGGGGKDSCQGDSGGPVYVQLKNSAFGDPSDDTWRVFGITSYGGACGNGGFYSMMHTGMEWFEQESGVDLTPCHDAQGNWLPTGGCAGFPKEPNIGGGAWEDGCAPGAVGGASQMCGVPTEPDDTAPTVAIIDPIDGSEYPGPSEDLVIQVDAQDVGWGIQEVQLIINGDEIEGAVDNSPPYEFEVTMPAGQWMLGAKAIDLGDNIAYAEEVAIGVGEPAPNPSDSDSETNSGSSDSGTGTGGTDGTGGSESDSGEVGTAGSSDSNGSSGASDSSATTGGADSENGCACAVSGDSGRSASLFGLLLLGLLRRRRS